MLTTDTTVSLYCYLGKRLHEDLIDTWTLLSVTVRTFMINVWLLRARYSKRIFLDASMNQYISILVYSSQFNTHILLDMFCYLFLFISWWPMRIHLFSILSQLINKYSTPITCLYNKKQVIKTSQGKYQESSTMPSSWVELCYKTTNSILELLHFLTPLLTEKMVQSLVFKDRIVSYNLNLLVHSI